MKKPLILFTACFLAGCATDAPEAFDPAADPRIGAEVDRACVTGSIGGGSMRIQGRNAFLMGRSSDRYLLVFSRGCGDLGVGGAFPVFRNFGDNCRRQGEIIETARTDFGVTGGCVIEHIYEWADDAEEAETDEE